MLGQSGSMIRIALAKRGSIGMEMLSTMTRATVLKKRRFELKSAPNPPKSTRRLRDHHLAQARNGKVPSMLVRDLKRKADSTRVINNTRLINDRNFRKPQRPSPSARFIRQRNVAAQQGKSWHTMPLAKRRVSLSALKDC